MPQTNYIAIDLGAESGRVMLGTLDSGKLALQEIHRFGNTPIVISQHLHWNMPLLESEIRQGITKAMNSGQTIHGISTDSWGVDYVLLDKAGEMLSPPFIYRDPRTSPHYERLTQNPGRPLIFENTGIQFMAINTLYQMCAELRDHLESAHRMLPIADYFNHLLTDSAGEGRAEISLASTTQLFDVRKRNWAWPLIERTSLPTRMFPSIVEDGTDLGAFEKSSGPRVLTSCSHDTACAVAAIPVQGDDHWAYLSSGTWSLVGVELPAPIVTARCLELGFTNELGAGGTTRLLKNVSGLYILQQCRAAWKSAGMDLSYETLAQMAQGAPPLGALIRPEAAAFASPGIMPSRIAQYCCATEQSVPCEPGQFVRCIYESLALLYRKTIAELRELTGRPIERLHIVGGGSQSTLLNQLAADACGIPVIAGPVEATSMGNCLIQARALSHVGKDDIRGIVRRSGATRIFEPSDGGRLTTAYDRFLKLPKE